MDEQTKFQVLEILWKEVILTDSQKNHISRRLKEKNKLDYFPVPHRIVRGNAGGKYTPSNIQWESPETHDAFHEKEIMGRKG